MNAEECEACPERLADLEPQPSATIQRLREVVPEVELAFEPEDSWQAVPAMRNQPHDRSWTPEMLPKDFHLCTPGSLVET